MSKVRSNRRYYCPKCGYCLLKAGRCSECGSFIPRHRLLAHPRTWQKAWRRVVVVLFLACVSLLAIPLVRLVDNPRVLTDDMLSSRLQAAARPWIVLPPFRGGTTPLPVSDRELDRLRSEWMRRYERGGLSRIEAEVAISSAVGAVLLDLVPIDELGSADGKEGAPLLEDFARRDRTAFAILATEPLYSLGRGNLVTWDIEVIDAPSGESSKKACIKGPFGEAYTWIFLVHVDTHAAKVGHWTFRLTATPTAGEGRSETPWAWSIIYSRTAVDQDVEEDVRVAYDRAEN